VFEPCPIPPERIEAFLRTHGLPTGPLEPIVGQAVVNWVFLVGETHVLRVNRPTVETDDAYTERIAVPAVRAAGIETPALLLFDDSRDVLDSVVTVYEQSPGKALGRLPIHPAKLPDLYRALGRQVAILQQRITAIDDPHGWLDLEEVVDSRAVLETARRDGRIDALTDEWLARWIEQLHAAFAAPREKVFAHNDLHAFNTLVDPETGAFVATIDWGDAGWMDPSTDFDTVPLWAVPWMLEGYEREGGTVDEGFIGRILWDAVGTLLSWEDHPGDEPWAPKLSSFWANLVRLTRIPLDPRWKPWLPEP